VSAEGNSLFHAAAAAGPGKSLPILKYLIELGIEHGFHGSFDVNSANRLGHTPLHFSAMTGDAQSVSYLISQDGKVDETDNQGNTPLHIAASIGSIPVIEKLVREGLCDLDVKNLNQLSPIELALQGNHTKAASKLQQFGASVSANQMSQLDGKAFQLKTWICHDNAQSSVAFGLQKELARSGVKSYVFGGPERLNSRLNISLSVVDKWKFASDVYNWSASFNSLLFVVSAESLKNERCLTEIYIAYTNDIQVYAIVYEDVDIPPILLKFIRKIVNLVPPKTRQRRLAAVRRTAQLAARAKALEDSPFAEYEPLETDSMSPTELEILLKEDKDVIDAGIFKFYNSNSYTRLPSELLAKVLSLIHSSVRQGTPKPSV